MIRIIEVGPRDGLQSERTLIPTEEKAQFIARLVEAGMGEIEVTSFVSPKWVPQLGDAADLLPMLPQGPLYSVLVPNEKGLERALQTSVDRIAIFTAASNAFTQKNINMTVDESLRSFELVIQRFREAKPRGWIRGYVSTAFDCPFSGSVDPGCVLEVAKDLLTLGVNEVSIGDTIGTAVPADVRILTEVLLAEIHPSKIAYHFHDTRGTAIANIQEALEMGISAFDSSAGGLGGCPYAPGAGGNLATEDLVYLLERSGIATGIDIVKLAKASLPILELLGRPPESKAQRAVLASCQVQA